MSGFSIALLTLFVAVSIAIDILVSPRMVEKCKARMEEGDSDAQRNLFRWTILIAWPHAALALVLLFAAGFSANEIGFDAGDDIVTILPYILAMPIGMVAATIAVRRKGVEPRTNGDIEVLIPRTKRNRRWYAGLATTAGITEEITYRALPLLLFIDVLPGHNKIAAVLLTTVLFGAAHYYQGLGGMLGTALMGALFAGLYLYSGSLWPSMLMHVLIDLRLLLLYPLKKDAATSQP